MKTMMLKVFRDIWIYKARSLLILLSVMIGMSSAGAVLISYTILNREMVRNFMDTNPASFVIYSSNLDRNAVKLIQSQNPGLDIELRKTMPARLDNRDGTYGMIRLRAVDDFNRQRVDTFSLERGKFPQNDNEIAIERDSFKILKNFTGALGEKAVIKLPGESETALLLSGVVHAPGLAPASMEHYSYGFVSLKTLKKLGYQGWYDEIRLVSHKDRFDRQKMRSMSENISKMLRNNGVVISRIEVPVPGRHPHASQLNSFLFILQAFTLISVISACLIIINLLNYVLSGQKRQIAVMKTTGATSCKIALPYFVYVMVISLCGYLLSIPLAVVFGKAYSGFAASTLNFDIISSSIPFRIFVLQAAIAVVVPMVSAAFPVLRCCSYSVKEGLYEIPATQKAVNANKPRKRIGAALDSSFKISAANLGRKRSRTLLAILALSMGGVLFMASLNITASVQKTVDRSFNAQKWDYDISLAAVYPETNLNNVLKRIRGLSAFEICDGTSVHLQNTTETGLCTYLLRAIPDSTLTGVPSKETSKLVTGNKILVNKLLVEEEPWIKQGSSIRIVSGNKGGDYFVAGIVNEVPSLSPTIYISRDAFRESFGVGERQSILAAAGTKSKKEQFDTVKEMERVFRENGIEISENWTIYLLRKSFIDHLSTIITFLSVMALLAVIVGGISIASAAGLGIEERKRELGVLLAVGAGRFQTIEMLLLESLFMGFAGWLAGTVLSVPISITVGNYFGQIFMNTNLYSTVSLIGALEWLILSLVLSAASSLVPAIRISSRPLRGLLAYE